MGQIYQREQRNGALGGPWWVSYYVNGRRVRESTGTLVERDAKRFLKLREGHVAAGHAIQPRMDRIRYEELADDLRRHYEVTGERQLKECDDRLKPLGRFFNGRRAVSIDGALAERYVSSRQEDGVA